MSDHGLTAADVQRYWSNVAGKIVEGWELATEWDENEKPTDWRKLDSDNPEDQQLLRVLSLIDH